MGQFAALDVPANNGTGTALAVPAGPLHTIVVSGAFRGTLIIEGSTDGTSGWTPLYIFQKTEFKTLPFPWNYMRVTRQGIPAAFAPGSPTVTVGACPDAVATFVLDAPVTLNGAGAGVAVDAIALLGLVAEGTFPAGTVVRVEISQDNVNWGPYGPAVTQPGMRLASAIAAYARMVVAGRTVADPLPQVSVAGTLEDTDLAILTPPVLNGNGAAIATGALGEAKTIIISSDTGDIPGLVTVQGSNDGAVSWCDVLSTNVPGTRYIVAAFEDMRMVVAGLTPVNAPTLAVNIGALACVCPAPAEGNNFTDISHGGV